MNKEQLRKVFVSQAVKHDQSSDKAMWLSSVWCEKVVGGYERGATLGLADDMSRSVDTVEDRSHGYELFKRLCLLDGGTYRRFVFEARRAPYIHFSHFRALHDFQNIFELHDAQIISLLQDIVMAEGGISSRSLESHIGQKYGDSRTWKFYARKTMKELSKLLNQPDLPIDVKKKAQILFSELGDES